MISKVFAGIVVDDLHAARVWYERVLGRPPDATPMAGLLEWHLAESGWLQVVDLEMVRDVQRIDDWGAAGSSSVAFVVTKLDDQLALLEANEIPIGQKYTSSDTVKTATVRDPAGNLITFVEEVGAQR